jgi:hypothetical protein
MREALELVVFHHDAACIGGVPQDCFTCRETGALQADGKAGGEAVAEARFKLRERSRLALRGERYKSAGFEDGVDRVTQLLLDRVTAAELLEVLDHQNAQAANSRLPAGEAFFSSGVLELAAEVSGREVFHLRRIELPPPVANNGLSELGFTATGSTDEHERVEEAGRLGEIAVGEQPLKGRRQQCVFWTQHKRRHAPRPGLVGAVLGEFEL